MFIFFEIHWDPCTRIFDTYYSMYRHCVVSSTYSNIPTYVLFIAGCNGLGCKRKTFEHLYISWSNESWRKFVDHSTDEKNWETNGRILWLTGLVFCFENCSELVWDFFFHITTTIYFNSLRSEQFFETKYLLLEVEVCKLKCQMQQILGWRNLKEQVRKTLNCCHIECFIYLCMYVCIYSFIYLFILSLTMYIYKNRLHNK